MVLIEVFVYMKQEYGHMDMKQKGLDYGQVAASVSSTLLISTPKQVISLLYKTKQKMSRANTQLKCNIKRF